MGLSASDMGATPTASLCPPLPPSTPRPTSHLHNSCKVLHLAVRQAKRGGSSGSNVKGVT